MISQTTLARPYAKAVFAIARDARALGAWNALLNLGGEIAEARNVRGLLENPQVSPAELNALFEAPKSVIDPSVREGFAAFIGVLISNRRLPLLAEIAAQFTQLRADFERTLVVRVTSALPIAAEQQAQLKAALAKRFDRTVELAIELDPAIIGGAIIHANDSVIDGSLRGKLHKLKVSLAA
jgi:F-type H+-transporting ATPase subunit delta